MIYVLTMSLLFSLMIATKLPPHLILSICFFIVISLLTKKRILWHKRLFIINICWIMFIIFFIINYFSFHNNEFYIEAILFICLISSMYVGIYSGIYFTDRLLHIFPIWVLVIFIQLIINNSIFQILNERWTITIGWLTSNAIGAALAFGVPLLILCINKTSNKFIKVLSAIEIALIVVTVFLLSSRGSILALTITAVYLFLFKKGKIKMIYMGTPVLLILSFIFLKVELLKETFELTLKRISSSGLNGREDLWSEGFKLIKSNPIYGIGARNGEHMDFHNPLLHISVHYGLIAAIPITVIILSPLFIFVRFKVYREKSAVIMMGTYIAIIVQSSFEAILTPLITGVLGWYFIGLVYGYLLMTIKSYRDKKSSDMEDLKCNY